MEELQQRISESEALGVRVIHIYPPSSIIGETITSALLSTLFQNAEVVTEWPVLEKSTSQSRKDAAEVWNYLMEQGASADPDTPSAQLLRDDEPGPPQIPSELLGAWKDFGRQFTIGSTFTSNYMVGRVSVKIALMESSGSSENWGIVHENKTIAEIAQGLDWLSASAASRGIKLQWVYDISRSVPTNYEPIQGHSAPYYSALLPPLSWEFLWIDDALAEFGVGEEWDGCFSLS